MGMKAALWNARLYAILDLGYVAGERAVPVCRELVAGGAQVVQLRAKGHDPAGLAGLAREVAGICRTAGVPFIVNDHPGLAREVGADGVHVGQDDLTVAEARAQAGGGVLVGKSTHSPEQARAAFAEAPDYIGFGPLFSTPTKPDYVAVGLGEIRGVEESAPVPVFCIGGIKEGNLGRVLAAGARRVVIVSGLLQAGNVAGACRRVRRVLDAAQGAAGEAG